MEPKLKRLIVKYWEGRDDNWQRHSAYRIVQEMKKKELCKHDMDGYRKLLMGIQKLYRDK